MTDKPTCASCANSYGLTNGSGHLQCSRGLSTTSAVYGDRPVSHTCEFERAWLWSLFSDRCGPGGKYWAQCKPSVPPTGGSGEMWPVEKAAVVYQGFTTEDIPGGCRIHYEMNSGKVSRVRYPSRDEQ